MYEHNHLTDEQIHAEVQQRLAEGKPVGRLLDTLQNRGEPTVQYQSQRTTSDIAAHARWKSYVGEQTPEENQELENRQVKSPYRETVTSREHDYLTNEQIHVEIRRRLAQGESVGRLINTLQSRGESTVQYQSQRKTSDLADYVHWKNSQGETAFEESQELERRAQRNIGNTKAKPWWKLW
jgi:hypothetical protein